MYNFYVINIKEPRLEGKYVNVFAIFSLQTNLPMGLDVLEYTIKMVKCKKRKGKGFGGGIH